MHRLLISILFFFLLSGVSGQSGAMRVEFDAEQESDLYFVVPCGEAGMLVLTETRELIDAVNTKWDFTFFDRNLVRKWKQDVGVAYGADYQDAKVAEGRVYLFFLNTGKIRNTDKNFEIIHFDLYDSTFNAVSGVINSNATFAGLEIMNNIAVAGLITRKNSSEIYFIDLATSGIKRTFLSLQDEAIIESITPDTANQAIDVIISNFLNRRQNMLIIFSIDLQGNILNSTEIHTVLDDKYLNTARLFRLDSSLMTVAGTYNNFPGRIPGNADNAGIESAGFFVAGFNDDEQEYINYYNFLELQNLKTGLTGKEYYQLQKRKYKSQSEYYINYELLVHDLEKLDDQYLLLAESFYPEYRMVSDISYDYWGRPVPQTYTVFDGYKFINAVVIAFDEEGELLWDNSMEIYNITTYDLVKRVNFLYEEGYVVVFYNEAGKITYKVMYEGEVAEEGLAHTELEPLYEDDRLMESGYNNMVRWYGANYLCYGYQKIRNNSIYGRNRRVVFYVNKVSFE